MSRICRSDVFEADTIGVYHCFNRIVRRSFLCGFDPHTGNDYSHRRDWFYRRLKALAGDFCIDVLAYAVLSNHFHLVLRNRPDLVAKMSDREVAVAWLRICPRSKRNRDGTSKPPTEKEIRAILGKAGRVDELRSRLSNPSWLIRQLCQHMGIRCNAEDEMCGHFWESRFGMRRLLDETAVLACMAYVDLNPVRGGFTESLEGYPHVSIGERLRTLEGENVDPNSWLAPLELTEETDGQPTKAVNRMTRNELEEAMNANTERPLGCLPIGLPEYADLLRWLSCPVAKDEASTPIQTSPTGGERTLRRLGFDPIAFRDAVSTFDKHSKTLAGCEESLHREAQRRGCRRMRPPKCRPLPRPNRQPSRSTAGHATPFATT